ncbi:protein HOTHEAD-like [Senna tora]|uniref:Protein HOTHEAD-like n=1 Tax=Senna tora TaxID=362788 RepID=A0A834WBP1_9FABA|nr:protein HOTHEAD-like [Senna tora]
MTKVYKSTTGVIILVVMISISYIIRDCYGREIILDGGDYDDDDEIMKINNINVGEYEKKLMEYFSKDPVDRYEEEDEVVRSIRHVNNFIGAFSSVIYGNYVVKPGDTLLSIQDKFVDPFVLDNNPEIIRDFDGLVVPGMNSGFGLQFSEDIKASMGLGSILFMWAFLAPTLFFHVLSYSGKDYKFVREATSAPLLLSYDYIIIGGGTCGCPLAATLSQGARVLVLERGGSPYTNPERTSLRNFLNTLSDTTPSSFSQQFISTDGVLNTRARVLGGGSVLNAGFYSRAGIRYMKGAGWNLSLAHESYNWVEKVVAFVPQVKQWQSAVRDGLLEVGVLPYNGFTFDHLIGTKIGGTIFDRMGHRHTAADLLQHADPRRISVFLHATVQKILFRYNKGRRRPEAYGVIFEDALGRSHRAVLSRRRLKGEIIVSAGAIGSPQLLMLSGLGPAKHLEAHKIRVVLDQPFVGQGMADNPMNILVVPSPVPVEMSLIQTVGITKFGSFIEGASGYTFGHTLSHRIHEIFEMVSNQSTYSSMFLPKTNKSSNIIEDTLRSSSNPILKGGVLLEKIMGPLSKGHLELITTNPNDNPLVTFNYFKEPQDLWMCVQGMETILRLINSTAFSRFRYRNMPARALMELVLQLPVNLRPKHASAASSLKQYCRDTVLTIWHYHGGCLVGKVVDHNYKVIGVDSLRVIDGSTFHHSPGTNPQATVMMLGR